MKLVQLGVVAEVIAGQSPEGIYYNSNSDGIPFYQGKKEFGDRFLGAPTTWTTKVTKLAEPGDILMSVRAPVGPINFSTQQICIGRGLASIRASELVDKNFLFYFLLHKQPEISGNTGAVFDSINKDQIASIEIPLPSLEKQRDIVKKLDSAFAEIDLLEENLDLRTSTTENLQASLLASFFDLDEDEVTEDYSFHSLGSVSLVKGGKRLPKGTKWSPTPTKYPYIRVTDMKLGRINEDHLVFVPDEIRPLIKNYTVNTGDIIISIAGTIGEIAVVPESLDKASLTENAAKIILQKEILDSDYCSYFLRSPVCRREIDSLVRTTTQPKLALFRIESLRIPIPPIKKQQEIVEKLNSAFAEIESLRLRIKMEKNFTTSLRQSFLSSAFTQEEAVA
jgi:type I restriction enzyme S subunit